MVQLRICVGQQSEISFVIWHFLHSYVICTGTNKEV